MAQRLDAVAPASTPQQEYSRNDGSLLLLRLTCEQPDRVGFTGDSHDSTLTAETDGFTNHLPAPRPPSRSGARSAAARRSAAPPAGLTAISLPPPPFLVLASAAAWLSGFGVATRREAWGAGGLRQKRLEPARATPCALFRAESVFEHVWVCSIL